MTHPGVIRSLFLFLWLVVLQSRETLPENNSHLLCDSFTDPPKSHQSHSHPQSFSTLAKLAREGRLLFLWRTSEHRKGVSLFLSLVQNLVSLITLTPHVIITSSTARALSLPIISKPNSCFHLSLSVLFTTVQCIANRINYFSQRLLLYCCI